MLIYIYLSKLSPNIIIYEYLYNIIIIINSSNNIIK